MRSYDGRSLQVTDQRHGWRLGSRIVPAGFTIRLAKFTRVHFDPNNPPAEHPPESVDLTEDELAAFYADPVAFEADGWVFGQRVWLELDIESSPTTPPRCVRMRAPGGIFTTEQRFPLAGIIAESAARLSSKTGSWELGKGFDVPDTREEYEDALFEADRVRGRRRARRPVTMERLADAARIARAHPQAPTAAVRRHLGVSRGYARRLIKAAEAAGLD